MSKQGRETSRAERAAEAVRAQQAAESRKRWLMIGGVVAVAALLIVGSAWYYATRDNTGDNPGKTPSVSSSAGEDGGVPGTLDGYGVFVGEEDAENTVTIYEDLQCPACANLEAQLGEPLAEAVEDGKVRVEYRMISFLDDASTNDYSSRAMNAALVVLDKSGVETFRAFHDDLYANQPAEGGAGFTDDELIQRAVDAGATEDEIRDDIQNKVYADWIVEATDQSSKDGVKSTPTIHIDGEKAEPQELLDLIS